ncbi:CBS domain-containing protein [Verrucomicrobiota bacterium]
MLSESTITHEFVKAHPLEAARILEKLGVKEVASFLKKAPPDSAAGVLKYIDRPTAAGCLELMDVKESTAIVARIPLEIASPVLRIARKQECEMILRGLPDKLSGQLRVLLRYPEGTAGAIMDPQAFTLPEDITIKEALKRLKKHPEHVESYIYVLNRDNVLTGLFSVRELIFAGMDNLVSSVMTNPPKRLSPGMRRHAIMENPDWNDYHLLPVVDETGIFLGAIKYQDINRLESKVRENAGSLNGNHVAMALGELYWTGLSSIMKGAFSVFKSDRP